MKVATFKYTADSGNVEVEPSGVKQTVVISGKLWSCCDEQVDDTTMDDQADSHANTG